MSDKQEQQDDTIAPKKHKGLNEPGTSDGSDGLESSVATDAPDTPQSSATADASDTPPNAQNERKHEGTQENTEAIQPSEQHSDPNGIFIDEAQKHVKRYRAVLQFTSSSTRAAFIMLIAAIAAIIIANVGIHEPFLSFWNLEVTIGIGDFEAEMSLAHIINDIFMALFFLLVGLDIKYEMTVGELTNIRQAALPIIAAVGGVLFPIIIYSIFNASNTETSHGWGVPTATDIAFALGIMALLGSRVPNGLKVFLSTLAVADDIIAILVIAIFSGESPSWFWLACAAVVFVVLIFMNRAHVYALCPYILVGILLWVCIYMSGIHSTIAGVLLAFTIPSGSHINLKSFLSWSNERVREAGSVYDESTPVIAQEEYIKTVERITHISRQVVPPATRLEHALYPWVYFAVLPLFALTNADVELVGNDMIAMITSPVTLGVFFGLLLGKPIGIMLFSFLTVKLKIASLPAHVNWMHMLGAAILGGVGFTMAIFVANLAYTEDVFISEAKLGILSASLVAGIVGFIFLYIQANRAKAHGISYDTPPEIDEESRVASMLTEERIETESQLEALASQAEDEDSAPKKEYAQNPSDKSAES